MSNELRSKLEKQADHIELLEEELRSVHEILEERMQFAANLERDLEHLISQIQSPNAKLSDATF